MEKMTKKELETILEQHALWLNSNEKEGKIAILSNADLSRADLFGVDLSRANLTGVNLYGADLRRAILTGANLIHTNLTDANLTGAIIDKKTAYCRF